MINDDLMCGFEEISKHYTMAREILDAAGVVDEDAGYVTYRHGRIEINASTEHMLLVIRFDNRANTGNDYWSQPLNITSKGTIHHVSNPHLSEAEAKESRSKHRYIPWHEFLRREHVRVVKPAASAQTP